MAQDPAPRFRSNVIGDEMAALLRQTERSPIQVISTVPQMRELEAEWRDLARGSETPLTQFEWCLSAAEVFSATDQLFVVTLREKGNLVAIAPLALTGSRFGKHLEILGYQLCEPQQFLYRDEEALKALLRALFRLPHPLVIRRTLADAPESAMFRETKARGLRLVTGLEAKTAFVPLNGASPPLASRISRSRHATLRRKRKLAEKHGPVAFDLLNPTAGQLDGLLDHVFRVEGANWKGRAGTGLTADRDMGLFFRAYCRRAAELGVLRLGFMKIGDEIAAIRMDVEWGRQTWELKIGYDERFANCSPGLLLGHEALLHAEAAGVQAHHFLGEYEPWHEIWGAEQQARVTLRHYPASAPGGIALVRDSLPRLLSALRL